MKERRHFKALRAMLGVLLLLVLPVLPVLADTSSARDDQIRWAGAVYAQTVPGCLSFSPGTWTSKSVSRLSDPRPVLPDPQPGAIGRKKRR